MFKQSNNTFSEYACFGLCQIQNQGQWGWFMFLHVNAFKLANEKWQASHVSLGSPQGGCCYTLCYTLVANEEWQASQVSPGSEKTKNIHRGGVLIWSAQLILEHFIYFWVISDKSEITYYTLYLLKIKNVLQKSKTKIMGFGMDRSMDCEAI